MTVTTATPPSRPLYVLVLEQAVRELDQLIAGEGPAITARFPSDHGISQQTADLVEKLRLATGGGQEGPRR